jgi:hypothetical protein
MEKSRKPFKGTYAAYYKLVESGKEQAQTTHGDRYEENRPYSISSYVKGYLLVAIGLCDRTRQPCQNDKTILPGFQIQAPYAQ